MGRFLKRISMLVLISLFAGSLACAKPAQAQQPTPADQPSDQQPDNQNAGTQNTPSQQQPSGQQTPTGQNQSGSAVTTAPALTGAEQYTLGRMGAGRSYVIPSFQFAQSVSTSGTGPFGTSSIDPVSTISGLLIFHHVWSRYDFTAQYAGTGFVYNQHSELNTSAHNFTFSQQIQGRRSFFLLSDVVTYLPESSFGYARFSNAGSTQGIGYATGGLYGANSASLDTTFLPGQTILTGPSSQIGNSVVAEYDYETSPLSSLTLTGSYVLLRFPTSGYISNDEGIFRLGYNHTFTRKDSIGISYQAGIFRFGRSGGNFTNHLVSLTYRRTISRRLALQLGAGPQINVFNNSAPGQHDQVSWQATGLLNYRLRRTSLGLNYQHYTSGGSGVYSGARTDNVGMFVSLPVTRLWSINTNLGYAYNTTVQNANLAGVSGSYNSWYGSINVRRNLNRWMSLFFGYSLQQQLAGGPTCVGSTCGTFYTQQYFSFGLNWHPALANVE